MGKRGRIFGGVLLTVVFLWLALRNVDFRAVRDALRHASYEFLIPGALCCATGYLIRTLRWQRVLAPTKLVPYWRLFPVLMAGFAANNLLPARIGEFVRAGLLSREEQVSPSLALATIVVERVCDGLMLITLMVVTLLVIPIPVVSGKIEVVETAAIAIFGAATVVLILLLFFPRPFMRLAHLCLRRFPTSLSERVIGLLQAFIAGLEALRSPLAVVQIFGLTALIWLCEWGTFASVLLAFPIGISRGEWLAAATFLLVFVNLGIMIPSAPGYVGTYQLFAKLALGAFDVAEAAALALSFVAHALQYSIVTTTGLFCLWRLGFSPSSLSQMTDGSLPPAASPVATAIEVAD